MLALQYGVAARDSQPEVFHDVHLALFGARHAEGKKIRDIEVVLEAAAKAGADVEALQKEVESGRPPETIRAEHEESVERWGVFGVPTFIVGDDAAFVRVMHRDGTGLDPTQTVDRLLELMEWSDLNEFKRPRIPR